MGAARTRGGGIGLEEIEATILQNPVWTGLICHPGVRAWVGWGDLQVCSLMSALAYGTYSIAPQLWMVLTFGPLFEGMGYENAYTQDDSR